MALRKSDYFTLKKKKNRKCMVQGARNAIHIFENGTDFPNSGYKALSHKQNGLVPDLNTPSLDPND